MTVRKPPVCSRTYLKTPFWVLKYRKNLKRCHRHPCPGVQLNPTRPCFLGGWFRFASCQSAAVLLFQCFVSTLCLYSSFRDLLSAGYSFTPSQFSLRSWLHFSILTLQRQSVGSRSGLRGGQSIVLGTPAAFFFFPLSLFIFFSL